MEDDDYGRNLALNGMRQSHEPEFTFEMLDYARSHFTNITVPMFDLTLENREYFYWVCYNINELSRRTGDRIEFSLYQEGDDVRIKTYSLKGAKSSPFLYLLAKAVAKGDIDSLKTGKHIPEFFLPRKDPLKEKELRLEKLEQELLGDITDWDGVTLGEFDGFDEFDTLQDMEDFDLSSDDRQKTDWNTLVDADR